MEIKRELLWHPGAVDDLDEILHYCSNTFGRETARKVRKQILSDVDLLISQPNIGQVEPFYTIHPEYIYIHLLWNTRRDTQNLVGSVLKR